jgi:hypothetical protein
MIAWITTNGILATAVVLLVAASGVMPVARAVANTHVVPIEDSLPFALHFV